MLKHRSTFCVEVPPRGVREGSEPDDDRDSPGEAGSRFGKAGQAAGRAWLACDAKRPTHSSTCAKGEGWQTVRCGHQQWNRRRSGCRWRKKRSDPCHEQESVIDRSKGRARTKAKQAGLTNRRREGPSRPPLDRQQKPKRVFSPSRDHSPPGRHQRTYSRCPGPSCPGKESGQPPRAKP
jgi:hypothetical protein